MNEPKLTAFSLKPVKEPWREGFLIPVRNRLNNILEEEFLPVELKDNYLESWGEHIIFDDEFEDWYCSKKK
ncbi:MAG: hypothetical protein JXA77_16335 [Bacteroidales bacterium]|nr:hypothetical protein [Bacteroidales bacterium]MBN2818871.1 hypothetical protein [Bacteroidales bacterium]